MQEEEWRPVVGYDVPYAEAYEVSSEGRVRSIDRIAVSPKNGRSRKLKGRVLKPATDQYGYKAYALCLNGVEEKIRAHRIVAKAFIENPDELPEINHKDGVKDNNNIENLEWCTRSQNVQHAHDTGLIKPLNGTSNGRSKLNEEKVRVLRAIIGSGAYTMKGLGRLWETDHSTISNAYHRKTWRHVK